MEQIDAHAEPNDTKATSILSTQDQLSIDPLFSVVDQQQTGVADRPDPQHDLLAEPYFYIFISTTFLSFPTICSVNLPMSLGCGD